MTQTLRPGSKSWLLTLILGCVTFLALLASAPDSFRQDEASGRIYILSRAFFQDIPKQLAGPGRFRFVLQPLMATILGIRRGLVDTREGKPPYLFAMLFKRRIWIQPAGSGLAEVANLLLMGILLDSVFQWAILGHSYPGAALVVGLVLIVVPYVIARSLANRLAHKAS